MPSYLSHKTLLNMQGHVKSMRIESTLRIPLRNFVLKVLQLYIPLSFQQLAMTNVYAKRVLQ